MKSILRCAALMGWCLLLWVVVGGIVLALVLGLAWLQVWLRATALQLNTANGDVFAVAALCGFIVCLLAGLLSGVLAIMTDSAASDDKSAAASPLPSAEVHPIEDGPGRRPTPPTGGSGVAPPRGGTSGTRPRAVG